MKQLFTLIFICLVMAVQAQDPPLGGCVVTFEIGNNTTLCSSQNVFVLPEGSPAGGTYSGQGVLDDLFFPSIAGPGEHIITYSYDDGFCSGTAQDVITVVTPQPILLSGDFEICLGDATTISASNATDIEWSTNEMGESVLLAPSFTTIYSVSGYDENFCITSEDFMIEVYALPDVVISGNTDICQNQSTELVAFGAEDYVWDTGEFTDVITVTPLGNMQVCVIGTDNNGCVSEDCTEIILHGDPEITISGETDVCMGSSTTLQAGGGLFYAWNTGETSASINFTPLGGDEVCVYGEDQFGCSAETCVMINLLPFPQLILFGDAAACVNEEAVVYATGAETYVWSTGDENDTTTVLVNGDTSLLVTGTGANGCTAEALWNILAFESPVLEIEGNTAGCYGDIITLIASGAEAYTWNNEFVSPEYSIEILVDTTIIVVGVNDNFCSTQVEIDLTVLDADVVEITGVQAICPGEPISLTATGSSDYVWSNGTEGETAEFVLNETTEVMVTGTNENGCSSIATAQIEVLDGEGVNIIGDLIVCPGDTIVATIEGLDNPVWDNETTGETAFYALAESGPISVTGTNSDGCVMTYSENATINPLPDLEIAGDLSICLGDVATLQASGAIQYLWSTGSAEDFIELNPSTDLVITLEGVSNLGCTDIITVLLEVNTGTPIEFELGQEILCDNAPGLSLSATPSGGEFSGEGVVGSTFTPQPGMDENQVITYTYVNEFGCTSQSSQSIFIDNCSGVDEMKILSFSFYPNPAEDQLFINSDVQGSYTLMITNAHGQLVRSMTITTSLTNLSIADLSAGVYELTILQGNAMVSQSFIKM